MVLNGTGKDFCVGRAGMGATPAVDPEAIERRRQSEVIFNSYAAFRAATVPVIAVVRGLAAGYGCAIAGVADITIAAESATFQIPEMAHRIMPTMVMSALMDRVSRKDLTYLVYSTAIISAARAREAGIVSEVVPGRRARCSSSRAVQADHRHARSCDQQRQGILPPRPSPWTRPAPSTSPATSMR